MHSEFKEVSYFTVALIKLSDLEHASMSTSNGHFPIS